MVLATSMLQVGRGRDPARPDAGRRPAEEHRRVHPGVLPGRPRPRTGPAWWSRSATGRGRGTWRTSSSSGTTTRRSTPQVEALSVTPFSVTSLDRGLDGVLVSAARVLQAVDSRRAVAGAERRADRASSTTSSSHLIDALVARARRASDEDCRRAGPAAAAQPARPVGPAGASTSPTCARRWSTSGSPTTPRYDALMMSAENAQGAARRAGRPAVRGRQLHARGAAGDQPAGQPDQGQPGLHRAARHAAVGVAREEAVVTTCCTTRPGRSTRSGDADQENEKSVKHNRAKVGSSRPSTLLYTYGPGAIMDLPQFTIMPTGLDDWDRIWNRRDGIPRRSTRRGCGTWSGCTCAPPTSQLRPHPWQPKRNSVQQRGQRSRRPGPGVPAVAALHRLRHARPAVPVRLHQHPPVPHRPGLLRARASAPGGRGAPRKAARRTAVPARYLLACATGTWTSSPTTCGCTAAGRARRPRFPRLKMIDRTAGKGASAMIRCESCERAAADERGAGPGGRGEAAEVPRPAPAPGRVRAGRLRRRDQADAGRRVQPVVPGDPVDHRDAGIAAGEGRATSPTGSASPSATGSPGTRATWRPCATSWTARSTSPSVSDDDLRTAVAAALAPPPTAGGAGRTAARLGSGRPARPRVAVPAAGPVSATMHEDPVSGLTLSEAGARPAAAGRDHPGAGGGAAAEGERARRLHPDRRPGPRRRRAQAAGTADPHPPARRGRSRPRTGARGSSCSSTRTGSPRGKQRVLASRLWAGAPRRAPAQLLAAGSPRPPRRSTRTRG